MFVLDIGFCAARPLQLVLHQIGVMGRGNKVMIEWLMHVLVHGFVGGVKDGAFFMVQVHQETIFAHVLVQFGWVNMKTVFYTKIYCKNKLKFCHMIHLLF